MSITLTTGLAAMTVAAVAIGAANAASPVTPRVPSAAERRAMELQATSPAQDLWENGDWWHDARAWQRT